jgi:hypothetical protein
MNRDKKPSPAMERLLARKAAEKRWPLWKRAEHVLGVLAAIAAILGVGFWLSEGPDREQERSMRRAELIARAETVIVRSAEDGWLSNLSDPQLVWAMRTLAELSHPIMLKAKMVFLADLRLSCATILVSADQFHAGGAELNEVALTAHAPIVVLSDLRARQGLISFLPIGDEETRPFSIDLDGAILDEIHLRLMPRPEQDHPVTLKASGILARDLRVSYTDQDLHYKWITDVDKQVLPDVECLARADQNADKVECPSVGDNPGFLPLRRLDRDGYSKSGLGEINCPRSPYEF